jgi:hypothetical protein
MPVLGVALALAVCAFFLWGNRAAPVEGAAPSVTTETK